MEACQRKCIESYAMRDEMEFHVCCTWLVKSAKVRASCHDAGFAVKCPIHARWEKRSRDLADHNNTQ